MSYLHKDKVTPPPSPQPPRGYDGSGGFDTLVGGGGGGTHPGFRQPLQNGAQELWLSMCYRLGGKKGGVTNQRIFKKGGGGVSEGAIPVHSGCS